MPAAAHHPMPTLFLVWECSARRSVALRWFKVALDEQFYRLRRTPVSTEASKRNRKTKPPKVAEVATEEVPSLSGV